jgi:hypothetical protein
VNISTKRKKEERLPSRCVKAVKRTYNMSVKLVEIRIELAERCYF